MCHVKSNVDDASCCCDYLMIYCIVSFVWDNISGKRTVCIGSVCHGHDVSDNDVRIKIRELNPSGALHIVYNEEMQLQSYTILTKHRLTTFNYIPAPNGQKPLRYCDICGMENGFCVL